MPNQLDRNAPSRAERRDGAERSERVSRVQATDRQRREVHRRLLRERGIQRISHSRLGVALTVGSRIPRRHHLHRLSPAILALAPIYASYSYILVDDTICIVDPETYVIVDVIPPSIERAEDAPLPRLALTPAQMHFIYDHVPKERQADVRVRLALGAEIPRSVELLFFPPAVIAEVPQIDGYRYIVARDDVVIVDPRDNSVALVISE